MAKKMITRTVKLHEVTTGRFDLKTLMLTDVDTTTYTHKLTARERKAIEEKGVKILQEREADVTLGMDLDDFVRFAHMLTEEEAQEQALLPEA